MIFNSPMYYDPVLNRSYHSTAPLDTPHGDMPKADYEADKPIAAGYGIKDIGMSVPMGISAGNVEGLSAKIRSGVVNIEIQFPGAHHGNRQQQTPEMYGRTHRQAIRELAKVNEVNFTTHSSFAVMGMTGQDQRGFSNTGWMAALNEVKRAIDFAAEATKGGSVVVHTGEFDRPITHIYPNGFLYNDDGTPAKNFARDENERLMFRKKTTEAVDFSFQLLDERTGQIMETVQGDRLVTQPVWLKADKDYDYKNPETGKTVYVHKGDYIDHEKRLVDDPFNIKYQLGMTDKVNMRVPDYDSESGRFKTTQMHHDDFEREAMAYNRYFEKITGRKPNDFEKQTGREMFLKSTLMTNAGTSLGWALYYGEGFDKDKEMLQKLKEMKEYYRQLNDKLPEEERWKIMRESRQFSRYSEMLPPETKNPVDILEHEIKEVRKRMEQKQEASTSQEQQAKDALETIKHLTTPEKHLQKHGIRGYALAGLHAMDVSSKSEKPVVITMENIYPERFGGHPVELKWLINKSRDMMVRYLTDPDLEYAGTPPMMMKPENMSPEEFKNIMSHGKNPFYRKDLGTEEAKKIAETHIKATFDTAHMNLWRKYFQPDPKKDAEQNDEAFKKWYLSQFEELVKAGMIGNIHLSDNFGYQDDHLSPGQGNAPVRDVAKILSKYGYKGAITVEPGAAATTDQGDFWGLMDTWKHFGSEVYSGGYGVGAPNRSWTDVHNSYFGQVAPPYFVFGAYAPSNDWTLWSQVPME